MKKDRKEQWLVILYNIFTHFHVWIHPLNYYTFMASIYAYKISDITLKVAERNWYSIQPSAQAYTLYIQSLIHNTTNYFTLFEIGINYVEYRLHFTKHTIQFITNFQPFTVNHSITETSRDTECFS